jgi:multidrug resistance efflux pump
MKHRIILRGAWLLTVILAMSILPLVGCGVRSPVRPAGSRDEGGDAESPTPAAVGLGRGDVEGGILSLYPSLPGRVTEVPVVENQEVQAGAVLLQLDNEAARSHVEEAKAALEAAQAQLAEARKAPQQHQLLLNQQRDALTAAQHELAAARLQASRKEELAAKDLINRKEADAAAELVRKLEAAVRAEQAKLAALSLRDPAQEVRRAEADVRARQSVLTRARHALQEHTVRAPSDGQVLRILTQPGEVLGPQPRQAALLFVPDKPRIVRTEVDQEIASQVAVGQRAEIVDDTTTSGPTWKGRVVRVAAWFANRRTILPDTPALQDIRTLECIVQLDPGQPLLRIGQRVRVKFFNNH